MVFERELLLIQNMLDETDAIAMSHFGGPVPTELKADGSPVTVADRTVEERIRTLLGEKFPKDAILGEEMGGDGAAIGVRRWIVDPIDGTKNYARGIPVFATLLALEDEEGLALGIVSAPALGTRWWATRGGGAFRDAVSIAVSAVGVLADAEISTGSITHASDAEIAGVVRLARTVRRTRGFGDFWGHMLVAQGSIEAMIEFAPLAVWDIAAPKIIAEEAGGRVTSIGGEEGLRPGNCITTNTRVHDEVRALVTG